MKNTIRVILMLTIAMAAVVAATASEPKKPAQNIPPFPGTLVNARYVYVTSYDGEQFNPDLLPEDRQAIAAVQDAIQKWGKFTVVYKVEEADIVLAVTSRPTEDILALYDAHSWQHNGQFLWRMTGRNGLQPSETPLLTNLKKAFESLPASK